MGSAGIKAASKHADEIDLRSKQKKEERETANDNHCIRNHQRAYAAAVAAADALALYFPKDKLNGFDVFPLQCL